MDITLWIEILLFIVLMVFSGFFSSSETSLLSFSKMQLQQMRPDNTPNMRKILNNPPFTGIQSRPVALAANLSALDLLDKDLYPLSAAKKSGCTGKVDG